MKYRLYYYKTELPVYMTIIEKALSRDKSYFSTDFIAAHYTHIYTGELANGTLDKVFELFNSEDAPLLDIHRERIRIEKLHTSISLGDIIGIVSDDGTEKRHIVLSIGFMEL